MQIQFRPIENWPGQRSAGHRSSQFKSNWSSTIDLLEKELEYLNARNIVLQVDVPPADIRIDGSLRANVQPRTPAVIVSFDCKHGSLNYPCDRFTEWRDNVRAVALSLQALRAVDRYGVTRRAEQYTGWAKLPAQNAATFDCPLDAKRFLESIVGKQPDHVTLVRRAKIACHPDVGGSPGTFKKVNEAAEMLGVS